jgi:hypothetical protein
VVYEPLFQSRKLWREQRLFICVDSFLIWVNRAAALRALARVSLNMPQHYQAKLHTLEILMPQQSEFAEPQLIQMMQVIALRGATPQRGQVWQLQRCFSQRVGRASWLFYRSIGKRKQPAKIQAAFV